MRSDRRARSRARVRRGRGIALQADDRKLYTANELSNDVSVVDLDAARVVKTIPADDGLWGLALGR